MLVRRGRHLWAWAAVLIVFAAAAALGAILAVRANGHDRRANCARPAGRRCPEGSGTRAADDGSCSLVLRGGDRSPSDRREGLGGPGGDPRRGPHRRRAEGAERAPQADRGRAGSGAGHDCRARRPRRPRRLDRLQGPRTRPARRRRPAAPEARARTRAKAVSTAAAWSGFPAASHGTGTRMPAGLRHGRRTAARRSGRAQP